MAGPLAGIRVLDISERSPSAAVVGMVLSDLGAEVVRVEPVGGDSIRALPGSRVWLRGQKSVTVGPKDLQDGSWQRLRASADVVLDAAQVWTAKPAGLLDGWPDDEGQVLSVLTAFPRSVPEVAPGARATQQGSYGELIEAQYGLQSAQEGGREGPIFLGWPLATYGAAWLLAIGTLGALFGRERTGQGEVVTTSLLDGVAVLSTNRWVGGANIEAMPARMGRGPRGNARTIMSLFQCGDGRWVQVHTGPRGAFDRLMKVIGRDDLVVEGATPQAVRAMQLEELVLRELWDYLTKTFKSQPSQHWCDALGQADVCCMPALPPGDALWLEQFVVNDLVDIAPDGARQLGKIAKYSRTPMEIRREVPGPGQHNAELLGSHQAPRDRSARPNGRAVVQRGDGAERDERVGPLDGLLVLDFGDHWAGPFSPRIMADLGARVIKIEERAGAMGRGPRLTAFFLGLQRGKESLAIDLKTEAGRAVAYELVKKADIVHHNMRLGATVRLHIDYESFREVNPKLIYCHSSGYGNEGPWSHLPTFEPLHSALGGLLYRTAGPDNPPTNYLTNMDYGCALTSTVAVLAALVERERSGQGQHLEVPQTGAALLAMSDVYGKRGEIVETFTLDLEQRGHAPTNALYRTQDGWIAVACYSDREWQGVRRALGIPVDGWPSYAAARRQGLGASPAGKAVELALSGLSTAEAEQRLRAEGVPCATPRPFEGADALSQPAFRERGVIQAEDHPEAGEVHEVGHTIRFASATRRHTRPAPVLGQSTEAILRELGRSQGDIEALIADRVVHAAGRAEAATAPGR